MEIGANSHMELICALAVFLGTILWGIVTIGFAIWVMGALSRKKR